MWVPESASTMEEGGDRLGKREPGGGKGVCGKIRFVWKKQLNRGWVFQTVQSSRQRTTGPSLPRQTFLPTSSPLGNQRGDPRQRSLPTLRIS